ncbi:MAG: hypothetical protein K6D94_12765 [Clostridiales bacterium]|nr:hypothetical protein [Clostridiales bacterium]
MRKNILSLLLAALMSVSVLAACGESADSPASGGEGAPAADTAAAETAAPETTRTPCRLPADLDFGGAEFRQAIFDWQGYRYYFFAVEENGDVMNDALYRRKMRVEETLNVKINTQQFASFEEENSAVKKTISAGEDAYDQSFLHCISGVSSLSSGGFLYNADKLPYLDFDAEWWNKRQMDVMRLGKNTYFLINDMMIPCPYVIFFNKEMVANFGLDNPYQLVYDGKWTIDAFDRMARAAVADVDGNGTFDINDSYGVTCNEISKYIAFMPAADQFMTKMNDEGHVELDMNTDKMVSLVERFYNLTVDHVVFEPSSMSDESTMIRMNTGRMMFELNAISQAEEMRGYEVDFGFLPYPKYDEKQAEYYSLDWGGMMCVPTTVQRPEMVGAVIELLAYESGNEVIPTYYDTILTGKLARDDDAVKMMDLLFDTICYEVGGNYFGFDTGFSDLFYTLGRLCIQQKKTDFASWYAKNEKGALKTLEKFYKNLEAAEEG